MVRLKVPSPVYFKNASSYLNSNMVKNIPANNSLLKIASAVGIEKRISFHTSRHTRDTRATRALNKWMKIHHVSKLLGNASVCTYHRSL